MSSLDLNLVFNWWKSLENDRGGRAELRRAHDLVEIVFVESYHRLNNQAMSTNKEALALVSGICAHIKTNRDGSVAEQMAEKVSVLRFRRLLAITDLNELYHAMTRIVRLLGGAVNVRDLAKTVYQWDNDTKKNLAYGYYAKAAN